MRRLVFPQDFIRVAVDYYDEAEAQKLSAYPTATAIHGLVETGVTVPTDEFLTYYLFHRRRPGKPGWRTYREVAQHVGTALEYLDEWVSFNGQSLSIPEDVGRQERDVTEHIGESIGLSVVNRIHDLTAADWDRIPERGGRTGYPTFDYQIASDGKNTIQAENKGCSISAANLKAASVSNQKKDIEKKKARIRKAEAEGRYPYPSNLHYGTITILGRDASLPVRCLLADPPPEAQRGDARNLRVVQRMRFLSDWISFISPRSQLAAALQTRLASLIALPDPFLLDGVPLLRGNGTPFEFEPIDRTGISAFFASKSRVADGPAGGVSIRLPNKHLFFLGIRDDLVRLACHQSFHELVEWRSPNGVLKKTIRCLFTEREFERLRLPTEVRDSAIVQRGHYAFRLPGYIYYSNTGIVFGLLPTDGEPT